MDCSIDFCLRLYGLCVHFFYDNDQKIRRRDMIVNFVDSIIGYLVLFNFVCENKCSFF